LKVYIFLPFNKQVVNLTEGAIKEWTIQEKLATLILGKQTEDEEKQNHITEYVLDTTIRKVNKT